MAPPIELYDPTRPIKWAHTLWEKDREVERILSENPSWYESILSNLDKPDSNGCLRWQGSLMGGYGTVWVKPNRYRVHRAIWLAERGPLALGWVTDHLCENTACQNIDHLDAVPVRINTQRVSGRACDNPYPHTLKQLVPKVTKSWEYSEATEMLREILARPQGERDLTAWLELVTLDT